MNETRFQRLKLKCDTLLLIFCFNYDLRHYAVAAYYHPEAKGTASAGAAAVEVLASGGGGRGAAVTVDGKEYNGGSPPPPPTPPVVGTSDGDNPLRNLLSFPLWLSLLC